MNIVAKFGKVSWKQYFDFYGNDDGNVEKIKEIKCQYDNIRTPERGTKGSAGYDLYSPIDISLGVGDAVVVPTGIRVQIEEAWVGLIFPRSGLGFKYQVGLANTVGVIDADYFMADNEGHIMIKLVNNGNKVCSINAGDKFAQMIFMPYGLAEGDNATDERTGGFGSTGR